MKRVILPLLVLLSMATAAQTQPAQAMEAPTRSPLVTDRAQMGIGLGVMVAGIAMDQMMDDKSLNGTRPGIPIMVSGMAIYIASFRPERMDRRKRPVE